MGFIFIKSKNAGFSNKDKIIHEKSHSELPDTATSHSDPTPFIDRLVVTLKASSIKDGKQMKSAHFIAAEDSTIFKPTRHSRGYKRAYRIRLESVVDSTKWPFYEFAWNEDSITRVRIDFIPVDIGRAGLIDLHAALTTLMPNGWRYFIENGRVTRMDVAVDFPQATMADFCPFPATSITTKTWTSTGALETIEFGKTKGNQTMIYDRKAKRIAKGKSSQGKIGVRIERRLRAPNLMLRDLPSLGNPFANLSASVNHVPQPACEKSQGKWLRFTYAAQVMGLAVALSTLSTLRRKAYRAHFKLYGVAWWKPEAYWISWTKDLLKLGIADSKAWI